jgi:hypothetical protein
MSTRDQVSVGTRRSRSILHAGIDMAAIASVLAYEW